MTKPLDPKMKEARAAARALKASEMEGAIEQMSANGLTPQEISMLTGLKPERLYKGYRDCMMKGGARRTNEVAQAAYLMSVGGPEKNWRQADPSMAKFWLERRGGPTWGIPREKDEGPDLTRLSVPQLIELERALRPLARNPVLIDAQVEHAESRERGGGADAAGAGAEPDGGERVDHASEGQVPG